VEQEKIALWLQHRKSKVMARSISQRTHKFVSAERKHLIDLYNNQVVLVAQ
jgi:hypothetical protein